MVNSITQTPIIKMYALEEPKVPPDNILQALLHTQIIMSPSQRLHENYLPSVTFDKLIYCPKVRHFRLLDNLLALLIPQRLLRGERIPHGLRQR